jgi:hypothetical protein
MQVQRAVAGSVGAAQQFAIFVYVFLIACRPSMGRNSISSAKVFMAAENKLFPGFAGNFLNHTAKLLMVMMQ